jgi:tetratricopeptide (TPR) repeat protein
MFFSMSRIFAIIAGIILSGYTLAAANDSDFKEGVKAFKAFQYDKAIQAFERSQSKGNKSAALYYNLGVSYYKTAQYAKAQQAFNRLLNNNKFRQLAQYNLGLVNFKQQNKDKAIDWFRKAAADKNGNPKITALSNRMINKLAPPKKRGINGIVSFGYGHDDNVTLVSTGSPTNQSDNYTELFGYISIPVAQVIFNANLLSLDYQTVDSADFMQLSGGVSYPIKVSAWTMKPGLQLSKSKLNSTDFQTTTDVIIEGKTLFTDKSVLALRYRYSDIRSDNSAYDYLEGNRQQLRVQHTSNTAAGQLRLRYELELNDRQNLPTANYSPTRHTLRARLKRDLTENWQLKAEANWRNSQYDEAAGITREDTRYLIDLNAVRKLNKTWRAGLRYTYTDNKSNIAAETYTRNDVRLYADLRF